jgi:hypothetical protein
MKKTVMVMIAALAAGVANAADVSATADFASAYIFRGATLNDGLVFQPGVTISGLPIPEEYGAVTLGTWANYDISDYGGNLAYESEFSEVDYFVSYALPVKIVDLGVTYTQYTYPTTGFDADKEVAFSVGKGLGETGFYTSLAANYGLGGPSVDKNWYIQGALAYEKSLAEALTLTSGLSVGYYIRDAGKDGFNDAVGKVGLSYALTENWSIKGSVNYVAQLDDDVLPDGDFAYDKSFYGTLGVGCDF